MLVAAATWVGPATAASPSVVALCAPVSGAAVSRAVDARVAFVPDESTYSPNGKFTAGVHGTYLSCEYDGAPGRLVILDAYLLGTPVSISSVERGFAGQDDVVKPYTGLGIPAVVVTPRGAPYSFMVAVKGKELVQAAGSAVTSPPSAIQLGVLATLALKLKP